MADRCRPGDWVEVRATLLEPADRAPNLPPETAEKPLLMWVKGFATSAASLGEEVTVETMTGRRVTGEMTAIDPGYHHTFGDPPREISRIGRDVRAQVAEWRAVAGDASAAAQADAAERAEAAARAGEPGAGDSDEGGDWW